MSKRPNSLVFLQNWDCQKMQGFYFAPPMSGEAIVPLLSAGNIKPHSPPMEAERKKMRPLSKRGVLA